jgi:hypothetical protein
MNFFPTDIYSLIKAGGFNFLNKNQKWPVDDAKFNRAINNFHKKYFLDIENLDNYKKKILYVDFAFLYFISYSIHFQVLEKILIKKNIKIKKGLSSKNFIELNFKKLSNPFNDNKKDNKFLLSFKFLIKNLNNFLTFGSKKKFLSVGGSSILKKSYIQKNNLDIIETYPDLLIKPSYDFKEIDKYKDILKPIFDLLKNNIKKEFNILINTDNFLTTWAKRLSIIETTLQSLLKKNTKYDGILVESNQKPASRFLALYFLLKDKDAISFDHGNHANGRKKHKLLSAQLLSYNKFVTISKKSKESIIKICNQSLIKRSLKNIKIEFIKNDYLKKVLLKKNNKTYVDKSKNIMLMGWPMNTRKYFDEGPCSFFYNKMLFEIEIIKFLKKDGFNVFYKAHPERPDFIKKIYDQYADKVYFEKFENLEKYTDIGTLLFTNTCSSTFGYSLCTDKKIILLYNEEYFDEHIKELKKRISIIPCHFDKKYKVNFKKISSAINTKDSFINYDYVKKYLI